MDPQRPVRGLGLRTRLTADDIQTYIFPPVGVGYGIPPEQFYANASGHAYAHASGHAYANASQHPYGITPAPAPFSVPQGPAYGAPPPLPDTPSPVRVRQTTPADWSPSPSPPAREPTKKRGRGRPRGSGSTAITRATAANARKAAALKDVTAAKKTRKVPTKTKTVKTKTATATATLAEKENAAPRHITGPLDSLSDSESEDENDAEESAYKRWTDTEKESFFRFLLGLDAEGERRFTQHQKNPGHVYRRVCPSDKPLLSF